MKPYLALIRSDLRLVFREKIVIFFNYLMPLAFFFIFAQAFHAEQGGAILQVVTMVTVIGILGNGLFGAGLRAAQEREANILRRFKVAPISPLPLLTASIITGLVVYLPYVVVMLYLAKARYGMQMPQHIVSMFVFIVLGIVAIRSTGLIIAAVANSTHEVQIFVQVLYMSMLFLSGATIPSSIFPGWLLSVAQFIPASWLMTGLQGIMMRNETLAANWQASGALILSGAAGLFIAMKLFRWEKEEKLRATAKLWVTAVLLPFAMLGVWQLHAKDNTRKTKILARELARSDSVLIRNARIFTGNGKIVENGAVLVKGGRIEAVYEDVPPDPKSLNAAPVEAAGKTILPGLIDMHVHLGAPGGFYGDWSKYDATKAMERNLAAYLYSGVTAVRSVGDLLDGALKVREVVNSGEKEGAEFFTAGPLFTVPGGHGTEYFANMPEAMRSQMEAQFTRMPKTPDEAKQMVDDLKKAGVDAIKAILESGAGGLVYNRMDARMLNAISAEAHAVGLPMVAHTGDARDVEDALAAHVNAIEHGSLRQRIPDADFARMARDGVTYDPTLSVGEAFGEFAMGKLDLLNRSLVQQVGPAELLAGTRILINSPDVVAMRKSIGEYPVDLDIARDNLRRAYKAGVTLITGTDAGNMLVLHGPTVQHEIQLWVDAGIPLAAALEAATLNSAKALRAGERFGSIEKGKEATMLVVDGNPFEDLRALEAISFVMFKGERVNRAGLFKQQ